MFTNYSRSVGKVTAVSACRPVELGIRVHQSLSSQLEVGSELIIDGVKVSVARLEGDTLFCSLDACAMNSTLSVAALHSLVNVVSLGGTDPHDEYRVITGQIDFQSEIQSMLRQEDTLRLEVSFPVDDGWLKSLVPEAYLAINGMKGVVEQVDAEAGRMTISIDATLSNIQIIEMKFVGDVVNVEVERLSPKALQAVDNGLSQTLGELYPMFHQLLKLQGTTLENLAYRARAKLHQEIVGTTAKEATVLQELELLEDV